ncbi:hypothetical protein [Avibacterium gallinarum]|uniref:hypothetical protein n=1 Tax=Avibacterium gallinarum TaxID=755 RepID=UPI000F5130D5|nr:hypothetical protein [Avibacterium gallinarum]
MTSSLFPHSDKIFLTKNQPDVRFALARRDFPKDFISIRAVWTGNVIKHCSIVGWALAHLKQSIGNPWRENGKMVG